MSWLGSPKLALAVLIFICIWKGYPLVMIQLLAACRPFRETSSRRPESTGGQLENLLVCDGSQYEIDTFCHTDSRCRMVVQACDDDMAADSGEAPTVPPIPLASTSISGLLNSLISARHPALAVVVFLICIVISILQEEVVKRMNSQKRINALCYIGLTLGSLIVLVPILYMASTSFKSINEIMTSSTVTMFPKKFLRRPIKI